MTYTGKLTRVDFVNPHSWLYFEVTDANGRVSKHRCEMRSAHTLRRSGWTKELFPVNSKVTIEAAPDRADPNSCYLNTIRFENGSHMDRYGQYVKAGGRCAARCAAPCRLRSSRATRVGRPASRISRVTGRRSRSSWPIRVARAAGSCRSANWRQTKPGERRGGGGGARRGGGPPAGPRLYGGTELTALGEQAAAKFTRDDNPRFRCETTSIVFDWTFDGPVNRITQNKDTIVIQYGQMDLRRTVHMNMKTHPANVKPSRAGHSIGRWEGDVLVVDTVAFPAWCAERAGAPRRQAARRRTLHARSEDDEADAGLHRGGS